MSDKAQIAIERLKLGAQMSEQYYGLPLMITYSGGKDSEVLVDLAMKAKIPFEIVNSHTTADAPETVYHIRKQFAKWEAQGLAVSIHRPTYKGEPTSMWKLIPIKMMPPTRLARYCCAILKETTGAGRLIATGVRWEESPSRKNKRDAFEINHKDRKKTILINDNGEARRLFEDCRLKAKRCVNPIIDWTERDIWDYAADNKLCMNPLYGCGFARVGCVGCPLASKNRVFEFRVFPKYKQLYINAFDRMLKVRAAKGKDDITYGKWTSAIDVFNWWMENGVLPGQMDFDDIESEEI